MLRDIAVNRLKPLNASNSPVVIDCAVDCNEFVLPMLPPGGSIDDIITELKEAE